VTALAEILDEMADQIRSAMTGADWDIQVEPRMVLNPTPPAIDIYPADPSRDGDTAAFGETAADVGGGHWINVRARVAPNDHEANQEVLLALKDDEDDLCLVQAVYDDPTLGGHVADVDLASESGFVLVPTVDGSNVHIGVIWRFLVIPARS
jgi:hypothetical protein